MRGFTDEKKDECCGTCAWHQHEDITEGWVCVNAGSIFCTEWTDYKDSCCMWEDRKSCVR